MVRRSGRQNVPSLQQNPAQGNACARKPRFYRTLADLEDFCDLGITHAGNIAQQHDAAVLLADLGERGGKLAPQLPVVELLLGRGSGIVDGTLLVILGRQRCGLRLRRRWRA